MKELYSESRKQTLGLTVAGKVVEKSTAPFRKEAVNRMQRGGKKGEIGAFLKERKSDV